MKYPILKKRCRNLHDREADCEICGDCRRAWAKLCHEFEEKYELVEVRVLCKRCYGIGYYSSTYGQKPCEDCNHRGHTWEEKWKHKITKQK